MTIFQSPDPPGVINCLCSVRLLSGKSTSLDEVMFGRARITRTGIGCKQDL